MFNWLKKNHSSSAHPSSVVEAAASTGSAIPSHLMDESATLKALGDKYFNEGKLDDAMSSYQQAIAVNPIFAEAYNNLGNIFREQGLADEAERCLKQAILIKPDLANANFGLGTLLLENGRHEEAVTYLGKALTAMPDVDVIYRDLAYALFLTGKYDEAKHIIEQGIQLNPNLADFHCFLGNIHVHENNFDLAIACYQRALSIQPDFEEVITNIGRAFQKQDRLNEAVDSYRKALTIKPDYIELHYELGALLLKQQIFDEAVISFQNAITLKPDFAEAHIYLGNALNQLGKPDEALLHYHKSISINPELVEAHVNKGNILKEQGKSDDAIVCYQQALKHKPDTPEALLNLGIMFKSYGDFNQAIASYQKALKLKPDFVDALNNMGNVLFEQNLLNEALFYFHKSVELKPDYADAYYSLGAIYIVQRKNDEGIKFLEKALDIAPEHNTARTLMMHQLQHMCEWTNLYSIVKTVRSVVLKAPTKGKNIIPPFAFLAIPGATAKEQKQCAERWSQSEYNSLVSLRKSLDFRFQHQLKKQIVIGYISADLRNHPVAFLMAEIFELHDQSRFKIIAYAYDTDEISPMRERLESAFDSFIDISDYSYEQAARKIYSDQVDIIVDLTGHTQNNRCGILALRPAPIQVSYLGYPGTMGADFFDYLIADHFTIPLESQQHYTEKIARMPDCFQANDRTRPRPAPPSRSDCGLPDDVVVFCCFNQTLKITPEVFDIWCRLLLAVPGSVLWIPASNPQADINLRREAKTRGITVERLVLAPLLHRDAHLARLQCADLFLDTLPFNAGTTCSDALWMGLPVITCAGDAFASRMAGSLLTAIGTPELITYNLEDYFQLALDLATDRKKLETIRHKINTNRDNTPLFDSARFTRNLENIYIQMMDNYLQ